MNELGVLSAFIPEFEEHPLKHPRTIAHRTMEVNS